MNEKVVSAYDDAILRIQANEHSATALNALLWLSHAERPLAADELVLALAVKPGTSCFDEDEMVLVDDVLDLCAGLVIWDAASHSTRLVHQTAYEYFRLPVSGFSKLFTNPHALLTTSCVTYISYAIFASEKHRPKLNRSFDSDAETSDSVFEETQPADREDLASLRRQIKSHSLYAYAASNWGKHAFLAGESIVDSRMIEFLENARQLNAAWQTMLKSVRLPRPRSCDALGGRKVAGLHIASYYGIEEAVRKLLSSGANINQDDGKKWTPLCYAAYGGRKSVIMLLLNWNSPDSCSEISLSTAASVALDVEEQQCAIALLQYCAETEGSELQPEFFHTAAMSGLNDVLECLIRLRVDINSVWLDLYPLAWAAFDHEETVRLLLTSGAQVNPPRTSHRSALSVAVSRGKMEIVSLLLLHGADPNVSVNGWTPLMEATFGERVDIAKCLLENGAYCDRHDQRHSTAFHFAAAKGNLELIQLLLEWKADPKATDRDGNTSLHLAADHEQANRSRPPPPCNMKLYGRKGYGRSAAGAASNRDLTCFRVLLDNGLKADAANSEGLTPLHIAAGAGSLEKMDLLLERGAKLEAVDGYECTPLHYAIIMEQDQAAEQLARRGANVNATSYRYGTPLCLACLFSENELIQLLLERGADISASDEEGNTPLLYAITEVVSTFANFGEPYHGTPLRPSDRDRRKHTVKILVDSGANLDEQNSSGDTALHLAADADCKEAVSMLVRLGANLNLCNENGHTPLYSVCLRRRNLLKGWWSLFARQRRWLRNDKPESVPGSEFYFGDIFILHTTDSSTVRNETPDRIEATSDKMADDKYTLGHLHQRYCKIEEADFVDLPNCEKALRHPSLRRNAKIFRLLLKQKANTEIPDKNKLTILWRLAEGGETRFLRQLLHYGANTEATDSRGRTCLYASASNGYYEIIRLLLEYGARIEAATKRGRTPLFAAARSGHELIVQRLLTHGADAEAADQNDHTPLCAAAFKGHRRVVKVLLDHGADAETANEDGETPLWFAAFKGHRHVVKVLLNHGAAAENANKDGRTPLWVAAFKGHRRVVKALLDHGADTEKADEDGITPLWIAAFKGHRRVVQALLDHGADAENADEEGETPLWIAACRGKLDVVKLLLDRGAEMESAALCGGTALQIAARQSHNDVVDILCSRGAWCENFFGLRRLFSEEIDAASGECADIPA
ncbi:ankyrin repeats (3 copies) domain-containing protein [Cordyceps javanica]|nr:ankyrin repeats (3 copies) domain-containing protein [Cordyceps javanica]